MGCIPNYEKRTQTSNNTYIFTPNLPINYKMQFQKYLPRIQIDYIELKTLRSRPFTDLYLCTHRSSKTDRVIKVIHKSIFKSLTVDFGALIKNLESLQSIDHPNILKIFEVFEDDQFLYISSEHCAGNNLFTELLKVKFMNDSQISDIFHQILSALAYLHEKTGAFRDLNPENVLIVNEDGRLQVKIADIGNSLIFDLDSQYKSLFSTYYFVAPDVFEGRFCQKSDIWSVGMLLYVIISGKAPYTGIDSDSIIKQIKRYPFRLTPSKYESFNEDIVDLLKKMFRPAPELRISASEALAHPWLNQSSNPSHITEDFSLLHLFSFHIWSKLKYSIITFISSNIKFSEDCKSLLSFCSKIDLNNSNLVPTESILNEINKFPFESRRLSLSLFDNAFNVENEKIEYEKFILALMDKQRSLALEKLDFQFREFEFFEDCKITAGEMKIIVNNCIENEDEVWKELMMEAEVRDFVLLKDFLFHMSRSPSTLSSLKIAKSLKVELS